MIFVITQDKYREWPQMHNFGTNFPLSKETVRPKRNILQEDQGQRHQISYLIEIVNEYHKISIDLSDGKFLNYKIKDIHQ